MQAAPNPIVSFGQGCEGEPLLRARLIGRAIESIRRETSRGQLHINTNGSNPRALQHLVDAGLDSVRVSMFSAIERNHVAYYGPRNYDLGDMEESLRLARRQGLHTSINLLTYPGFTDCPSEVDALIDFFRRSEVAAGADPHLEHGSRTSARKSWLSDRRGHWHPGCHGTIRGRNIEPRNSPVTRHS